MPILTNGATHSAEQFRALVKDLARGSEGITAGTDLKVTQLSTPGGGVQIAEGSGIVLGRVSAFQGAYACRNQGSATVSIAATGAGTGRSDMIILRVEDKEYEGNIDPATGQVNYFQVISNVSGSATSIPDGRTGIPLARIDIPSSTSTITNAMITDLRKIANPRRERSQVIHSPTGTSAAITNSNSVWQTFSTEPGVTVAVPSWASKAIISIDIAQLRYTTAQFIGLLRATFGSSLTLQSVILDDNQTAVRRVSTFVSDTLTIPDTYRGTSQLLRPQATGTTGNTGNVSVDASTTLRYDIEFLEAPR
ncbi:hypothetical protein [Streptomyces longwoodensis]|uniref:hypothetical protein n=1 Tax=Streptomyces longwoodensis TaxID=68231 RepID=UPI0022589303|nr:hypothetical protein [Streptomyces longwoodensis]MCX5000983.1 hypothetical protein [Streptomyces longwoodensis]